MLSPASGGVQLSKISNVVRDRDSSRSLTSTRRREDLSIMSGNGVCGDSPHGQAGPGRSVVKVQRNGQGPASAPETEGRFEDDDRFEDAPPKFEEYEEEVLWLREDNARLRVEVLDLKRMVNKLMDKLEGV
jgi:hypothetical protein